MKPSQSFLDDYQALTAGRGFVELKDWSMVTMTGEDRHSFLHNMCTNDIKRLSVGECCEAFCTDVKGKIVSYVLIIACEKQLVLLTVPNQAGRLIAHLDRYIIREDVRLADSTTDYSWFVAIPGTARTDWSDGEGIPHLVASIYGCFSASMLGVAASDRLRTRETLTACGLEECGKEAWEIVRIEDELPLFDVDFDSSNLPQEVNRDHMTISFNKGCYLGQETIARIDALGHVNQKLVTLQFAGESVPPLDLELRLNDKTVGRVTSSCWSPKEAAPLALAMVRYGANNEDAQLQSECGIATIVSAD